MKTVLDTIHGGTEYLEKRGVEEARLTMQLMLAHVLGCERIQLYLEFDRPLDESQLAPMREFVKRRGQGEPLQHILGQVEFYGRTFRCDSRALIPRPETEELAGMVIGRVAGLGDNLQILDVGCGSGVLGLTLAAEWESALATLVDISPDALALARENADRLEVTKKVNFVHGDLFSSLEKPLTFDVVVANLPYVPAGEIAELSREVQMDPHLALDGGVDGLDVIRRFCAGVRGFTKEGGLVALEIGEGQSREVAELLGSASFEKVEVKEDLSGVARFVFGV